MKKNLLTILSLMLCVLFLVSSPACSGNETHKPVEKLMNGFENFDREVQTVRIFNSFGRVEQNSDKKYVKSGEKSLHIQPFGGRIASNTANPYLILPTLSSVYPECSFSDFTDVSSVSFWIYNAEEFNLNVGVSLQVGEIFSGTNKPAIGAAKVDRAQRTANVYYTLKSGWNFIVYEVVPDYLKLCELDLDNIKFKIEEVYGVAIEFDYVLSNDFNDAPSLYLDDVSLCYGTQKKSQEIRVREKDLNDGLKSFIMCDFETPEQVNYFYSRINVMPAAAQPTVKQVFAGDYGAIGQDSGQALLTLRKHGAGQVGDYVGLFLSQHVVEAAFGAIGDDVKNNPENYAFAFDCYNATDKTLSISTGYGGSASQSAFTLLSGQWTSCVTYNFSHLNNFLPASGVKFTDKPGWLRFAWGQYYSSGDYSDYPILLDNIRIEKIA